MAQRTASITTPAELGESQTSSLSSSVERHAAEGGAFQADIGPLAVGQPRHVVARADMDVVGCERHVELAGDGLRLGDLLGLQPLALEHVQEIGVAAEIELIGAVERDAALAEQVGQHAVDDGGAHLALDVVADDRQAALVEALCAIRVSRR